MEEGEEEKDGDEYGVAVIKLVAVVEIGFVEMVDSDITNHEYNRSA